MLLVVTTMKKSTCSLDEEKNFKSREIINIRTVNNSNTASDGSEHNGISLDPVIGEKENDASLPHNIDVPQNEGAVCEDTECLKPAVVDIGTANDM